MTMWLIASALAVAGLIVATYALFTQARSGRRRGPEEPDWLIPSPVELRRVRFPPAWRGYDPAHVDVYVDALAAAYEELYFTAGPSVVARARERLALRLGHATSWPTSRSTPEPEVSAGEEEVGGTDTDLAEELEDRGGDRLGFLDG